jgi:hypothetical protein
MVLVTVVRSLSSRVMTACNWSRPARSSVNSVFCAVMV